MIFFMFVCPSVSGDLPWNMKQRGLQTSSQRPYSVNSKAKRKEFFLRQKKKKKFWSLFDFLMFQVFVFEFCLLDWT